MGDGRFKPSSSSQGPGRPCHMLYWCNLPTDVLRPGVEFVASTHGTLSISTSLGDIPVLRPHTLVIVSLEHVVENLEKRNEKILKLQAVLLLIDMLVSLNHCFIPKGPRAIYSYFLWSLS